MSRRPTASDDTESGFLKRWSRRKAGDDAPDDDAAPGGQPGGAAADADERAPSTAGEAGGEQAERVKTDADMPDLDSIDDSSDMSDFLSPGVSEGLRNQALRRLFRSTKFNVIDPLDDYNEDFRSFAALGDIVTSDMRHRTEAEAERRRAAESDAADAAEEESAASARVEDADRGDEEPESETAGNADAGHDQASVPGQADNAGQVDDKGDNPPRNQA